MNAELILLPAMAALVTAAVHLTLRRVPPRGPFMFNVVKATFAREAPSPSRPPGRRFTESVPEDRVAKASRTSHWLQAGATR
jgi:hypothetical protein